MLNYKKIWFILLVISVVPFVPFVLFGIFAIVHLFYWIFAKYHYQIPILGVDIYTWYEGYMIDMGVYFFIF